MRAHQLVGHGVERAAPQRAAGVRVAADGGGSGEHVVGGAAGEGQKQYAGGVDSAIDEVGNPGHQRARLARPCAGQDHQG
jgi:hypothetical protein